MRDCFLRPSVASQGSDNALVGQGETQLPVNRETLYPAFDQTPQREQILSRDGFYRHLHELAARTPGGLLNQGTG